MTARPRPKTGRGARSAKPASGEQPRKRAPTAGGRTAEPPIALEAVVDRESEAPDRKRSGTKAVCRLFRGSERPVDFELKELTTLAADDKNMAWVDLSEYSAEDLATIAGMLDLHRLTIEAALDSWQRPRLDSFPDHFYMSTTVASADEKKLAISAGELGIWIGKNFLVTAHRRPLPFLDSALERLDQSADLAQLHTAFALYILLDELVAHYSLLFEKLEDTIELTEERALRETSDAFLAHLLQLKRYVFALGRLAEQHQAVFAAFSRPDFTFVSGPQIEPYFRDLQVNLTRVTDRLLTAREAVNGAFDIYVSHMAHRTNSLITILTVISTVLLPAALVVTLSQTLFALPLLHSPMALMLMVAALVLVPGSLLGFIFLKKLI